MSLGLLYDDSALLAGSVLTLRTVLQHVPLSEPRCRRMTYLSI